MTNTGRQIRASLLAAVAVSLLFAQSALAASWDPLTFVSFGGAYTRSQMLAFVRPWEKKTGHRVNVVDYDGGLGEIRKQVSELNVKWDVVDLEQSVAIRGCREGLLRKVSLQELSPAPDGTSAASDFIPGSLMDCAVGTVVWSTVIAYDARTYSHGPVPRTLKDFFDTDKFPGPRGLRLTPRVNLEWALMADGVAPKNVYKVLGTKAGLDRAFRMLDRLKPHIVWWRKGQQPERLLEAGKVVMTSAYNGRIYAAIKERHDAFRIIWNRQVWNLDLLGIVAHSPHEKAAVDFVRFATGAKQLARQSTYIPYGPVRLSSQAFTRQDMRAHLPTTPAHFRSALRINAKWWASHYEEIDKRFMAWVKRPVKVPRRLPH